MHWQVHYDYGTTVGMILQVDGPAVSLDDAAADRKPQSRANEPKLLGNCDVDLLSQNMTLSTKRIIVIDDHPSTRDGLVTRVALESDLEVVGEASDIDEAIKLIGDVRPDLAVIDISLKTSSGIDLVKTVKKRYPRVKVLVWSMYEESLYAERALRAGAMGYINKEHVTDKIIDAIRTILGSEIFLSKELSAKKSHRVIAGKESVAASPVATLSDRELETFRLIGPGMCTREIAKAMALSPKTIETYRARIKEKLELNDMASLTPEVAQWVLENG